MFEEAKVQKKTQDVLLHVTEVHTTPSTDKVNEYLKKGWVLLSIATGQTQTGQHDFTPEFAYCLGKIEVQGNV